MDIDEKTRLSQRVGFVGLRAQATTVGLIQLAVELRRAGVLSDDAIDRVKDAIASDVCITGSRRFTRDQYHQVVRERLDRLFAPQDTDNATCEMVKMIREGEAQLGFDG